MKLSMVLSTHAAKFQAVAYKGDFEQNVAKIAAFRYDGVEPAIRDPERRHCLHASRMPVPRQ